VIAKEHVVIRVLAQTIPRREDQRAVKKRLKQDSKVCILNVHREKPDNARQKMTILTHSAGERSALH
jgi:hypothetical protein